MLGREYSHLPGLVPTIDLKTRERLREPVIKDLYESYVSNRILLTLGEILNRIAPDYRLPILHTLTTHVTKEKPLFIYSIGRSFGVADCDSQLLAASVDLLWTLALIFDDIEDRDIKRAGIDTAWVVYGREKSYKAANFGLQAVLESLSDHFGCETAQLCKSYVDSGVESLRAHSSLTLDSSIIRNIVANYIKRADFHTTFPVEALFSISGGSGDKDRAINALRQVNLAGQILNDIKDFLPEYRWVRPGFSDIRNGLVTVPIKFLWDSMEEEERRIFLEIFGKGKMNDWEQDFIQKSLEKSRTFGLLKKIVADIYHSSWVNFQQVVSQESFRNWFKMWVEYKLDQVNKLTK